MPKFLGVKSLAKPLIVTPLYLLFFFLMFIILSFLTDVNFTPVELQAAFTARRAA